MHESTSDIDKELKKLENINEKVEYFRKRGKISRDQIHTSPNGDKILKLGGTRGKGPLKGVMIAYTNGDDTLVRIGFSMCHSFDKWDHVEGIHTPGFGKWIATQRGEKWASKERSILSRDVGVSHLSNAVIIPDSMYESFKKFVDRCKKYFKDKQFPEWIEDL